MTKLVLRGITLSVNAHQSDLWLMPIAKFCGALDINQPQTLTDELIVAAAKAIRKYIPDMPESLVSATDVNLNLSEINTVIVAISNAIKNIPIHDDVEDEIGDRIEELETELRLQKELLIRRQQNKLATN